MQHSLISDQLTVTINSLGAELCSIKNAAGTEFLWQAKKDVWPRHAPVLFPIVGKLKQNTFTHQGKSYDLSQHGFARDLEFTPEHQTENSCRWVLHATPATKTKFPFDFIFTITYLLKGDTLHVEYEVKNPAPEKLYFSLGAHPGFNCPLLPGETFEDYYLAFEAENPVRRELAEGLRNDATSIVKTHEKKLFLSAALFEKDALVFENAQINTISLCSSVSDSKISLTCTGWPFFGVWTKPGCREFVCLEPWFGIADQKDTKQELSLKEGIISLDGNETFHCRFSISIT